MPPLIVPSATHSSPMMNHTNLRRLKRSAIVMLVKMKSALKMNISGCVTAHMMPANTPVVILANSSM